MDVHRVEKINYILDELGFSVLDKLKLEKILECMTDEEIETGSLYELISSKMDKDTTTIKKFISKIIEHSDCIKMKDTLGFTNKPKSKEFLLQIYKKVNEEE